MSKDRLKFYARTFFVAQTIMGGLCLKASAGFAEKSQNGASETLASHPSNAGTLSPVVTPYTGRFALEAGDQAGGPVRYNTRFPTPGNDPNPSSYYHSQAFLGANFEVAFAKGAFQFGVLTRRDLAHRAIEGRMDTGPDGIAWTVNEMEFRSNAITCGWLFGRMYREAPWRVSLASVIDVARVKAIVGADNHESYKIESNLIALSLRGRAMWRVLGVHALDLHAGPELHVPVYSKRSTKTDDDTAPDSGDLIDLKSSAAIGLAIEAGLRF